MIPECFFLLSFSYMSMIDIKRRDKKLSEIRLKTMIKNHETGVFCMN